MRARRSWRAPWHYPTVAVGARRCVGVGFSALPRRLRRVDRRNRSRSCQRLAIPSTLFAFGPRPASRQPGTRTFVTERDFALQSMGLDCAGMRSNRHRSLSGACQFPARTKSCDRATCRSAPVMADTLPPCLRPATAHSPTEGETQPIHRQRTHDFTGLTATAPAQFTTFGAGTRRREICDSSLVRTSAQSRAKIELSRARVPYIAGCEFSFATATRASTLRSKSTRSLVAYGCGNLPNTSARIESESEACCPIPQPADFLVSQISCAPLGVSVQTNQGPHSLMTCLFHDFPKNTLGITSIRLRTSYESFL